tara:strand:- start:3780 stop:4118 length:339 start_codon:yes stop_codon:yes gene_type:complete
MNKLTSIVQGISDGEPQFKIARTLGVSEGVVNRAIWTMKWCGYKVPDSHTVRAVRKGGGIYNPPVNPDLTDKAKQVLLAEMAGTHTNKGLALQFGVTDQQMTTIRSTLHWMK